MRERAPARRQQSPYPRRSAASAETAPLGPQLPLTPGRGGQLVPGIPPDQGGELQAGLPAAGLDLQALQLHLLGEADPPPLPLSEEESPEEDTEESSANSTYEQGFIDPMAAQLKAKYDSVKNDIGIKANTLKGILRRDPATASTKRQSKGHLDQLLQMTADLRQIGTEYLAKLAAPDRDTEQQRLNDQFTELETSNSDLQEEYTRLIEGDDDFRRAQNPTGAAMYKAFSKKVDATGAQLTKLKGDMEAENQELTINRAQLYISSIERLKGNIERDLLRSASEIKLHHAALNTAELEKLHGYDIDLQDKLQQVTDLLSRLSMPSSVTVPFTSTPNVSMVPHTLQQHLAGAAQVHQALPGAASLPPPVSPQLQAKPQAEAITPTTNHIKTMIIPTLKGLWRNMGRGKGSGKARSSLSCQRRSPSGN